MDSHQQETMSILRTKARKMLSQFQYTWQVQKGNLKSLGLAKTVQLNAILLDAWMRDRLNRKSYRVLDENQLHLTRKSEKVFIFGCGYSLNDISPEEWQHISQHDTLGFNHFTYQNWIPVDYHLMRGGVYECFDNWQGFAIDYMKTLNENPYFKDTILILQGEYRAQFCNQLIGYKLVRPGTQIFRYTTARTSKLPTHSFQEGLSHNSGTLCDVVNFAYCLGWKEIVLVGVDLYDTRYFWLQPEETLAVDYSTGKIVAGKTNNVRGQRYDETHNTARNGIVEIMAEWRDVFQENGVEMSVYNPRSLLKEVMPVYRSPALI